MPANPACTFFFFLFWQQSQLQCNCNRTYDDYTSVIFKSNDTRALAGVGGIIDFIFPLKIVIDLVVWTTVKDIIGCLGGCGIFALLIKERDFLIKHIKQGDSSFYLVFIRISHLSFFF